MAVTILKRTLVEQVDARLTEAAGALTERPRVGSGQPGGPGGRVQNADLPSDYVVVYHDADGKVFATVSSGVRVSEEDAPSLVLDLEAVEPYTTRVDGGLQWWRVFTVDAPNRRGTVTVALPLRDVTEATAALRRTVLIVAGLSAVVGAAIAWAATRQSLRPLRQAEETAARITDGNLTLRLAPGNEGTEAGSLAASLNSMLDKLDDAFKAQARSEEKLRAFLSDASHELRTPLAAIQGYAELQRTGSAPPDNKAIERIEANAKRMGALVEDLLVLARFDETPASLGGNERLDLAQLAEDAVADIRAQAPDRTVTCTVESGPMDVVGSERQVRQLLANLGANALCHTPAGTAIDISCGRTSRAATVTVRDHGPGVPASARERVFDRFYRVDTSRTRDTGGSGLGLSIVAAIVEAHGGTVRALDADGGGAAFVVSLPLAD